MTTLYDPFKHEISTLILSAMTESFHAAHLSLVDIYKQIALPPDFSLGQGAFPCFIFAKELKLSPQKIASSLSNHINANPKKHFVLKAESVNAYLNFSCHIENLATQLNLNLQEGSFFKKQFLEPSEKEKIIIEYSQPNTHKAMHVGHLRCLVLGDAVCNLLEYAGFDIIRATYPGDVGTHVAKIIWYLTHPVRKELPKINKAHWLGIMYAKADESIKSFHGTNEEVLIKAQISEILYQINTHQGEYYDLWLETRQWSLDYLKDVYDWLNSKFDLWYFESTCEIPSKALVKKKYEEGFFTKDNGAIGIDLSPYKLGFAMYLKSDGNGLYLTKDLELIREKFSNPTVTKSIVIVDARQKFHFQQLFKTAELMGYPQAAKSVHLSYETVNTESGAPFSSRELNGLGLFDLRHEMQKKVMQDYLERYRNVWTENEIIKTAEDVTIAALKYGMLRVDNNTQIHFSLSEWLKLDGDTGPYLQYVHARCISILEKLDLSTESKKLEIMIFESIEEKELLFLLARFNDFVLQAALQYRPFVLANYLYDVAKNFNRFYEACSIKNSEGSVRCSRLFLVKSTQQIICKGLSLLGIPALNKM